jgi:hypothetical protein
MLWSLRSDWMSSCEACFNLIFDVEPNEVLGQFAIEGFIHFVEDEVEKVEAGNERRWEIDIASDR